MDSPFSLTIWHNKKMILYLFSKRFVHNSQLCSERIAKPSFVLKTSFGVTMLCFISVKWYFVSEKTLHFLSIIFCIDRLNVRVFYNGLIPASDLRGHPYITYALKRSRILEILHTGKGVSTECVRVQKTHIYAGITNGTLVFIYNPGRFWNTT